MGMTIKEAIPILHDMYNYYNDVDVDAYVGFDNKDNNAIEIALDTMRKYQEIEKIVEDSKYKPPLATLNEIIMVVSGLIIRKNWI